MKVITLLENTSVSPALCHAHGLSLYIETPNHKILFDMGPSAAFAENAEVLGVDLSAVDIAFLSHGHDDHSGGLEKFLQLNDRAKVYLHKDAFGPYYAVSGERFEFIGVDPALQDQADRFVFCDGVQVIDGELQVFSDIRTADYRPSANATLRQKVGESYQPEDFLHEQNLILCAEGKNVLLAGCAHRGIVNILRRAEELLGESPDAVFAGFHLFNPGTGQVEPEELICAVAEELASRPTRYYTGHCTGRDAYARLKARLGDQMDYMAGGAAFSL